MYHVQLDGMKNGAIQLSSGGLAIVDTGTTNLILPGAVRAARHPGNSSSDNQLLPGIYQTLAVDRLWRRKDGSYMIPCTRQEGVADLMLTFAGQDWPIDYQDIVCVRLH
jgi:hypothetical protein